MSDHHAPTFAEDGSVETPAFRGDGDGGSYNAVKGGKGKGKFSKDGKRKSSIDDITRSLPVSADAERAALSCMLKNPNDMIGQAVETLSEDYFYIPAHRIIYDTLLDMFKNKPGGQIDLITLNAVLTDRDLMDSVGGPGQVAELMDDVPTTAFFEHYCEILKEKFILRRIIQDCTKSIQAAYDDPENVTGLLDSVEKDVLSIRDQAEKEGEKKDMKTLVYKVIEEIEEMYRNRGKGASGLETGFTILDEMTNGLHGGEMIVVAARPSMGKTSFVMNIVENVTMHPTNPKPAAVFSLEMTAESLVQRLVCSNAEVQMQTLRGGFLSQTHDFPRITNAAAKLAAAPIYIDDTPALTIMELRAKARRLKKDHDIQLIAIDYLQLLKAPNAAKDSRQLEIAEISGGVKALAKELDVPIIVLAQLNRSPDARGGKPKMSDLRESGAIEQDADLVGLLIRPEVYADSDEEKEEQAGFAQFIIAKQRNGAIGEIDLTFRNKFMRFENRAKEDPPPGGGDGF